MKVYILKLITINHSEPKEYSAYRTTVIVGIYSSYTSAVARMEDLHDAFRKAQLDMPNYITESCEIEEHEVIK